LPELNKGKGVILQRYKDGYLEDIKSISRDDGIIWILSGGRQRTEKDISVWVGKRGSVGKMVPNGFPRPPKFD
jgi:topoisomerase-4 subunit A